MQAEIRVILTHFNILRGENEDSHTNKKFLNLHLDSDIDAFFAKSFTGEIGYHKRKSLYEKKTAIENFVVEFNMNLELTTFNKK